MPNLTNIKHDVDIKAVNIAVASKSCLSCKNYRATHSKTKASYCADGSKTVFDDSGCDKWVVHSYK